MINRIAFTGREEMLTAGLKNPKKMEQVVDFFKADAPHGISKAKAAVNRNIESYVLAHQPIKDIVNGESKPSNVIDYFG